MKQGKKYALNLLLIIIVTVFAVWFALKDNYEEVLRLISSMEDDMAAASRDMDFEEAARLRDQVVKLKSTVEDKSEEDVLKDLKKGARKGSAYGNRKHAAYGSSRAS